MGGAEGHPSHVWPVRRSIPAFSAPRKPFFRAKLRGRGLGWRLKAALTQSRTLAVGAGTARMAPGSHALSRQRRDVGIPAKCRGQRAVRFPTWCQRGSREPPCPRRLLRTLEGRLKGAATGPRRFEVPWRLTPVSRSASQRARTRWEMRNGQRPACTCQPVRSNDRRNDHGRPPASASPR